MIIISHYYDYYLCNIINIILTITNIYLRCRYAGDRTESPKSTPHATEQVDHCYHYRCHSHSLRHHQSSVISHQSSVISHQSSVISHQSSVISHQSSVISHQSSVISHQSSVISHQSSVISHQSSVIIHQSSVTSHQSPVTSHQSPVTSHQSAVITRVRVFQIGVALGFLVPTEIVRNDDDLTVVGYNLSIMLYSTAVVSTVFFVIVVLGKARFKLTLFSSLLS